MSHGKRRNPFGRWWQVASFLAPTLILIIFYIYYPIANTFRYSFFNWDGMSEFTMRFVGLQNYQQLMTDPVFWGALKNNLLLVALSLLVELPLAFWVAYVLKGLSKRWSGFFRSVYFIPSVLSLTVVSLLWTMIYNYQWGLLNKGLDLLGLKFLQKGWLGDPHFALYAVFFVVIWIYVGYYMVIYMAGLNAIPDEIYEAARIDGANSWQSLFHIAVPLMRPMIQATVLMSIIGSFKYFDLVFIMTQGGPFRSTELLATYMYERAFNARKMGYGATIAIMILVVAFVATIIQNRLSKKDTIELS